MLLTRKQLFNVQESESDTVELLVILNSGTQTFMVKHLSLLINSVKAASARTMHEES